MSVRGKVAIVGVGLIPFGELFHKGLESMIQEAFMNCVKKVVESAKAYLEDAKYYKGKNRFEVSLASVAYCEGLLDALRMLGVLRFEWKRSRVEKSET